MTNEEAIEILRGAIKKPNTENGCLGQAIIMAVRALEQQPCEDCVSREDALMALTGEWTESRDEILSLGIRRIKALPSVTPTRARGKWMTEHNRGYVKCSNCHKRVPFCKRSNFCPWCGADMRG